MIDNEHQPLEDLSVATILDLGANIGLASAWFLSRFPNARAFAVEADPDNFAVCQENLAPYGDRARVLHGAVWSHQTTLTLHHRATQADNWVQEPEKGATGEIQVQGWDLPSLIAMSGFEKIDLLKIDIEGAEANIFQADPSSWLGRVRNLCIELHGPACQEPFFAALSAYDYRHQRSGELDICTNLQWKFA
jgi:FkbM family methyltransferase